MPFYTSKDTLLHCKRASFTTQKGVDGKAGRKEIDKEEPPEIRPPQAPPKEGMCLAGYRMLGVGDIKEKRIKPQRLRFNSQRSKVWKSKHALSHTIHLSFNS